MQNEDLKSNEKRLEDAKTAVMMDMNDKKNPVKPYTDDESSSSSFWSYLILFVAIGGAAGVYAKKQKLI